MFNDKVEASCLFYHAQTSETSSCRDLANLGGSNAHEERMMV